MTASDPRREAMREMMRELLEEAEIRRIDELTPEQMREEAKDSGLAPGEGLEMLRRAMAAPAAPPRVVSLDERRRSRAGFYAFLAAAALILLVIGLVWQNPMIREQIDAWFSPKAPAPAPHPQQPLVPPTHEETPKEQADRLREEAYVDIAKGYFDYAWDELEQARELDPEGSADPRVRQAYKDIEKGAPEPVYRSKPGTAPFERPLQKQPPSPH